MSAILRSDSWPVIHRQFETALPQIDAVIRYHSRRWPKHQRNEMMADARAAAWHAWFGLLKRGKDPMAVGPTGLARNACRYVKGGRRLGTGTSGRSAMDVYNRRAQQRLGIQLVGLDPQGNYNAAWSHDRWPQWSVADNSCTPADQACFQLDFEAWLASLPHRKRQMAVLLADGHETGVVARNLGVTAGAVSLSRGWLAESWRRFQNGREPTL